MCRLFESLKVYDRKLVNVEYHNSRLNKSRYELFKTTDKLDLASKIIIPDSLSNQIYKCRVIYTKEIESVDFMSYQKKIINKIKIVERDSIVYNHKYDDRNELNELLVASGADEIIIVKNGLVTDSSYSNLIFSDGKKYITPKTPLLCGTKRAQLLNEGLITQAEIRIENLNKFEKVYFINALNDLDKDGGFPIELILK